MIQRLYECLTLKVFAVTRRRKLLFIASIAGVITLSSFENDITRLFTELPYVIHLVEIVFVALLAYIFASGIRILIVSRYRKKNELDSEDHDNFTIGASALVGTATVLSTIVSVFTVLEIEFFAFLTSIALFSVALATIFKDTIQNFIEGLAILFSANYRVGDYVQIANHPKGIIVDITLSKIKLKLSDGSILHLSNHTVNSGAVTSFGANQRAKIKVAISVPQKTDLATLTTDINAALTDALKTTVIPQKTTVSITDVGTEALTVSCDVTVTQYSFTTERKVIHAINAVVHSKYNRKKAKKK